jgi:hypothetical protein
MNREKIAKELLKIAEELLESDVSRRKVGDRKDELIKSILDSGVKVRVYEPLEKAPFTTHFVIIGNEGYEMGSNANRPDGVNMYAGKLGVDFSMDDIKMDENEGLIKEVIQSEWERLPIGLLQGIVDRIG